MMRCRLLSIFLLAGLLAAGAALGTDAKLGHDGALYSIRSGSYSELFPQGSLLDPDEEVKALDVRRPGAPSERHLVPHSEDSTGAAAYFDIASGSDTVFVVFESWVNVHAVIRLVSFDGATWSEPIDIKADPFSRKRIADIVVSSDSYWLGDEDAQRIDRTVVHLAWWEDDYSVTHTYYTPVLFENAVLETIRPTVLPVEQWVREHTGTTIGSAQLFRSPRLIAGSESGSVILSFASETNLSLANLEIRVLRGELGPLAEDVGSDVADDPSYCELSPAELEDRLRMHIPVLGARLNVAARQFVADAVVELAAQNQADDCSSGGSKALGERLRMHIPVLGAFALTPAVSDSGSAAELETLRLSTPSSATRLHVFALRTALQGEVNEALSGGPTRLHAARDGRRLIVSWRDGQLLHYQGLDDSGIWSEAQVLELGPELSLFAARELVDQLANR